MDTNQLQAALLLVAIANRVVEAIAAPIRAKYPDRDLWWLVYVAWIVGALLVFFSGSNLFLAIFALPIVGQLLTAIAVGGGAGLLSTGIDAFKSYSAKVDAEAQLTQTHADTAKEKAEQTG